MGKNIYLFSGLGADYRVYQYLDLSGHNVTHVEWVPAKNEEELHEYARRLTSQITDPKPILIGMSFGGIVAQEIAAIIPVEKLIIISSAKLRSDIPKLYRVLGPLFIKLTPKFLLNEPKIVLSWMFGIRKSVHRRLFYQILNDTDKTFLKWAMLQIVKWKGASNELRPIHIHGSNDFVLPLRSEVDHIITGGGHFMVVDKSNDITKILSDLLN